MRTAHIVTERHELGDRVMTLCGKEWKVKTFWADLPEKNPICRTCIDTSLAALNQLEGVVHDQARPKLRRLELWMENLNVTLNPADGLLIDAIADRNADHWERELARKEAKAGRKKAKTTCTCTWKSAEVQEVDPQCPIHGSLGDDAVITTIEQVEQEEPAAGEITEGSE